MTKTKTTVIVGAGLAGLSVADQLVQRGVPGRSITILEKYDYIGGRIVSASRNGASYEIGAGRIHKTHRRMAALIERYGLKTYDLDGSVQWRSVGSRHSEPNLFEPTWNTMLALFAELPRTTLATHTLRELAIKVLGPDHATLLLERFPYRAETERMRADMALRIFSDTLGTQEHYYVVVGGLRQLTEGLTRDLKARGVKFRLSTPVRNVVREPDGSYRVEVDRGDPIKADQVILALHASAVRKLPVMRGFAALSHVTMEPLTRIYAQYPTPAWFGSIGRVVSDSPLRYIIPIDATKGLVMISYTDDRDTKVWAGLQGPRLQVAIQKEVRRLFPELMVPEPLWIKSYEWTEGCSYWIPGDYDPAVLSKEALRPRPATMPDLYCVGESFSLLQAWMEGALEHAEMLLDLYGSRISTSHAQPPR